MPRQRPHDIRFETRLERIIGAAGRPAAGGITRVGSKPRSGAGQQSTVVQPLAKDGPAGQGQVLVLSGTGISIADGGGYVAFDSEVYRHGFDDFYVDDETIRWPLAFAGGSIQVEIAWDTYDGGGMVEIEVNGQIPAWGLVGAGTSGSVGCKRRAVHCAAGDTVRIKVTQSSGSSQTVDVCVEFVAPAPSSDPLGRYVAVVLEDGPLAYWRLDEAAGTSAADRTGNGHTATYTNGPTLGAAPVMRDGSGNASANFAGLAGHGTGQHVAGSNWADMKFLGAAPFSVEAWLFMDSAIDPASIICFNRSVTVGHDGWVLGYDGGNLVFDRENGSTRSRAATPIATGQRHHAVGTFDGTTSRLYLDGMLVATDSTVVSIPDHTSPLRIAAGDNGSGGTFGHFAGRIDEVAVYDLALSAAQIAKHHEIGSR